MAVFLSPVGGVAAQFFTNTGAVLTGGKLYTYSAGTTTPAATYTNSGGNTPQPNPIVLDAAGRVSGSGEIWLSDGVSYKFVLKDSNDVLIATYDNIIGINSNFIAFTNQQEIVTATAGQTVFNLSISYSPGTNSLSVFVDGVNQYGPGAQYAYVETDSDTVTFVSGLHVGAVVKFATTQQQGAGAVNASQVTYNPTGTGAVATNVQAKLRQTVSVMDFGAVGDGATDDTAAIQAALNASSSVYIPAGTYKTTAALTITGNSKFVYGDGANSVIKPYGAINAIQVGDGVGTVNLGGISNILIQAGTTTVLRGIYMQNAREFDLSGITIFGIDDSNRSFVNQAIFCTYCWRCNFTSIYGLYITGDAIVMGGNVVVGTECNAMTLTGCKVNRVTGYAYTGYGAGYTLSGCSAEACTAGGALFRFAEGLQISGGYYETCGAANLGHAIKIGQSQQGGAISGVYIAAPGQTNYRAIELTDINGLVVNGLNFTGLTGAGSYGIYTGSSVTNVVALANISASGTGNLYGGTSYPDSFKFDGANLNYGASIGLGATISKFISATSALTPSVIPAVPGYVDATIAVTGAAIGDTVTVGGPVTALLTTTAYVAAPNQVNIRWLQLSAAAATPTAGTYRVDVWQH